MKNYLMFALILCAIPAVAVGQTVSCDQCTHVASVYMGEGGVIAMADDTDTVTWVATCGGVTRSDELMANDDGVVAALWTGDLACMADGGGTFEIGPVMDGGWFWVTDDMNSAVGGLIDMDVLDNEMADITSAGDGISMTMGKGAVFLKEAASGRVGILPNILPEPPVAAADVCGPRASRSYPYPYNGQQTSSCMLGGGGTKVRLQGPGRYGGLTDLTGGMVTRNNAGGGNVTIYADLWLDESGSYTTATAPASGASDADITAYNQAIQKGWAGKTATAQGAGSGTNWLTDVAWAAVLHGATPGASASTAGVTVADANTGASATATPDAQAEITIAPSSSYCPTRAGSRQTTATVLILAFPGGTDLDGADGDLPALPDDVGGVNQIHPALATDKDDGYHAVASITVGCPPRSSSSANPGQELVPENLFPTDG